MLYTKNELKDGVLYALGKLNDKFNREEWAPLNKNHLTGFKSAWVYQPEKLKQVSTTFKHNDWTFNVNFVPEGRKFHLKDATFALSIFAEAKKFEISFE